MPRLHSAISPLPYAWGCWVMAGIWRSSNRRLFSLKAGRHRLLNPSSRSFCLKKLSVQKEHSIPQIPESDSMYSQPNRRRCCNQLKTPPVSWVICVFVPQDVHRYVMVHLLSKYRFGLCAFKVVGLLKKTMNIMPKGRAHQKMKILSLFTHPHVVPSQEDFLTTVEHKSEFLKTIYCRLLFLFFYKM